METQTILSGEFFPILKTLVTERIAELKKLNQIYENILKDRRLEPFEFNAHRQAGRALKTNELFMILFDSDYLVMQ